MPTDFQLQQTLGNESIQWAQRQNKPGFLDSVGAAVQVEHLGFILQRTLPLGKDSKLIDESWSILKDKDLFKQLTDGLPPEYWRDLGYSINENHAWEIRQQLIQTIDAENLLRNAGASGFAARMIAGALDPVETGAAILLGGLPWLQKGSFVVRLAKNALIDAGIETVAETARVMNSPEREWQDVAIVAAGSIALNSLTFVGADFLRMRSLAANAERTMMGQSIDSALTEAGGEWTDQGRRMFGITEEAADFEKPRILGGPDPRLEVADPSVRTLDDLLRMRIREASEAELPSIFNIKLPAFVFRSAEAIKPGAGESLQRAINSLGHPVFSQSGRVKKSKSPLFRKMARMLARDPIPGQNATTVFSASEIITKTQADATRLVQQSLNDNMAEQATRLNMSNVADMFSSRKRMFEEATTHVIRGSDASGLPIEVQKMIKDPAVISHATSVRKILRDKLDELQRAKILGFEDVVNDDNYIMRIGSADLIRENVIKLGDQAKLKGFLTRALINAAPEVDKTSAAIVSDAWLKGTLKRDVLDFGSQAHMFDRQNARRLKEFLVSDVKHPDGSNITIEQADTIVEGFRRSLDTAEKNLPSRAKHRISFDENYSEVMTNAAGDEFELRFSDLLENNSTFLSLSYTRQANGLLAENAALKAFDEIDAEGIVRTPSWNEVVDKLAEEADKFPEDAPKFKRDLKRIERMHDLLLGHKISSGEDTIDWFADKMMLLNRARLLVRFGPAQLPEFGIIAAKNGIRSMVTDMPAFGQIIRASFDGKFTNNMINELRDTLNAGLGRYTSRSSHRYAGIGNVEIPESTSNKFNRVMTGVSNVGSEIGGLRSINDMQEMMITRATYGKFGDAAQGRIEISPRRLRSFGIKDSLVRDRIYSQLQQHATWIPDLEGKPRIDTLNLGDWEDMHAAAIFQGGIMHEARISILHPDIGDLPTFFTSPVGQMLGQFRTFTMASYENLLLRGIYFSDTETYTSMIATMFGGALTYVLLQNINAAGRDDKEEFLRERLKPENIALGAVQRAGFTGIIPGIVDTGMFFTGNDPLFQYGRTSQMNTDILTGSATYDLFSKLQGVGRAAIGTTAGVVGASDYQFSRQDYNNILGVLPWVRAYGLYNMLQAAGKNLPAQSLPPPEER